MNLDAILKRITPTDEERREEMRVIDEVLRLLKGHPVKPILVGSIAKDTDLAGNKDIDIFIQFTPDVSREDLEKQGLRIGKDVFAKLKVEYEIDYAEHPYVKGELGDNSIEIVPCYLSDKIMSAVDRTPHHTKYVIDKLSVRGLKGEIRLLKQFMRGIGIYGAEAKVEGFSGYLVELLVIHYGSFIRALEAARAWSIPEVIDVEHLWEEPDSLPKFFVDASLIVVDPVDKSRNVAAAVSPECLSKFIVKADEYVRQPSEEYFFPKEKPMRNADELKAALMARRSKFLAVVFKHGRMNENTLYSQLRKTSKHIAYELGGEGFKVFRHTFWSNSVDTSTLLFEFEVWQLPELEHRLGPPIDQDAVNQERFSSKYKDDRPYVEDGRWVVDTRRRYRHALEYLRDIISDKRGFGKNFREMENAKILEEGGIFTLTDPGWLRFLNEYLD